MDGEEDEYRLADFTEEVKKIFQKVEAEISVYKFNFQAAKTLVISLQQLVKNYKGRGCLEANLEAIVLARASQTASSLVDGVNERQEEVYDPRQTLVCLYSALSVSSLSVTFVCESGDVCLKRKNSCSLCMSQLRLLHSYCHMKGICESPEARVQNLIWLVHLLVNLASWLEPERPAVACMIVSDVNKTYIAQNLVLPRIRILSSLALVVFVSSRMRMGLHSDTKEFHKLIARTVNVADLPAQHLAKYYTVYAKVLYSCGQYTEALDRAKDALSGAQDMIERREIEQLLSQLENVIPQAQDGDPVSDTDDDCPSDTNIGTTEISARQTVEVQNYYNPAPHHKRNKRSSITTAVNTSYVKEVPAHALRGQNAKLSCPKNLSSDAPARVGRRGNSLDLSDLERPLDVSISNVSLTEPPAYSSGSESEDDEDVEKNLQFVAYDDEEEPANDVLSEEPVSTMVDDDKDWFEKSVEMLQDTEENFTIEKDIELDPQQKEILDRAIKRENFYNILEKDENKLEGLVKSNPHKYKRCLLKIESAHKSIARVLGKGSKFSEILICGRSKCGQTYMDDEVVVEVLAEPGQARKLQAKESQGQDTQEDHVKMAHGHVVGMYPSKRARFRDVEHPILICTLDEIEGHLMKPLCKTVPKIHVMNDKVREKYPVLSKHRLEIKQIVNGNVEFKRFLDIDPDRRDQYVFKVVILSWRLQSIYPLGAILEARIGGRDFSSGLEVLSMQHSVPGVYPREVIHETQALILENFPGKIRRLDLTAKNIFTIDPPGSQDLDDALSIWKTKNRFVVGIHIADVASFVKVGTAIDEEAKRRAFTFYPGRRKPRPMFPEPLSHGKCSLLPGQERLALSVFFCFDKKGKLNTDEAPQVKKTIIKSTRQFSYDEIQKVIDGDQHIDVDQDTRRDVLDLQMIASQLREARIEKGGLFVPFEDPRLHDIDNVADSLQAHSLVEEFMILTNKSVAKRLRQKFPHVMILRSHKPPTYEQLAEWREKEGNIANLVMQLQGKKTSPSTKLSVIAGAQGEDMLQNRHVIVQKHLYNRIDQCLEEGNLDEARRLLFMDSLHPLQCLAYQHWMEMMETAEYKCSHGLNQPDHYHFGLDIEYYTHFTSPIRRYVDLHVHRLLYADLDGKAPNCKAEDVVRLCQHLNNVNARQKAFGRGCRALAIAEKLRTHPLVFRAYVDSVDSEQLTFCLPSLLCVSDRKQEISFSMLGVSSQPEVITDTIQKKDMATVRWGMRLYNECGTCPRELVVKRKHVEYEARVQKKSLSVPLDIGINPHQLTVIVGQREWAEMLKMLMDLSCTSSPDMPFIIDRGQSEVSYMSSENGDGTVSVRRVRFSMTFSPGQVVPVQMSAEPKKGLLKPRVELVQITRNAGVCTQHISDPVSVLSYSARESTRYQTFNSYKEYKRVWMPLLEMEAAYGAATGDSAVVIENVKIEMKCVLLSKSSGQQEFYQGTFSLPAKFCFDRGIEFGGKSAGSTGKEDENKSISTCPMDYLCLRCRVKCEEPTVSRVQQSNLKCVVDDHYTWIGHGGVIHVAHKNRQDADGGRLVVTFVLSRHSSVPPLQLLRGTGHPVTLEILPKSQVDRRAQEMLFQLEDEGNELAQAIAYNKKIPQLDKDRRALGFQFEYQEIDVPGVNLPRNNNPQHEAIVTALTNSVSLIQGPPGTGKTYTGIKLIYLFTQINRRLAEGGMGKKIVLFCGPSNKAVDLVARLLKLKFGNECPKMVRLYGSAIECKDYPIPRGDLQSSRGMRDLTSDPELQDVSLHHIIRDSDKPFAEKIATFEKYFDKCRSDPENFKVTSKQIKDYKRLLHDASVEELAHHEVIFATCAVGGNSKLVKATKGNIFQVIIDECAMSPEPHSLVPIVANKAKQVVLIGDHKQLRPIITCQGAAELGLDQSLFERLYKKSSVPCVFLSTQYRMHPIICTFPSTEFYDGLLKTGIKVQLTRVLPIWPAMPKSSTKASDRIPHILVDVRGEEETLTVSTDEGNERSKSNSAEADKVIEILKYLKQICAEKRRDHEIDAGTRFKLLQGRNSEKERKDLYGLPEMFNNPEKIYSYNIKVLTQYNAQRHLLEEKLKKACEGQSQDRGDLSLTRYDKENITVGTVVSSQGGEWDYVVLSTVRSLPSYKIEPRPTLGWCRQNMGFITDQNQVNVALTRARHGIIIVGNAELLKCDSVWNRLVTRYEELGCVYQSADFSPSLKQHRPRGQVTSSAAGF